jgi:ribosome-binding protein aMBF1 (putative translation factor)
MNHSRWRLSRERKIAEGYREPPEVEAEREQLRLLIALGQAVHDRRVAMGLSEAELADRLGVSSDEVEGIELGDPESFHPTVLPLLVRALEAEVDMHLGPGGTADVRFSARAA